MGIYLSSKLLRNEEYYEKTMHFSPEVKEVKAQT